VIGRCEAVDLVLPDPDDGGEPTAQRCKRSGRQIVERDPLLRHTRVRVVCDAHGLDTAPASIIVPEVAS
jgi:hypothetical protein